MFLYHLDRNHTLHEGETLNLFPVYDVISDSKNMPFAALFSEGISEHGKHYLDPQTTTVPLYSFLDQNLSSGGFDAINTNDFMRIKGEVDSRLIEFACEMVRKIYFPYYPSRFQSLFAVKDINEFLKWPEFLGANKNAVDLKSNPIFQIQAEDQCPCFDSQYLKGGIAAGLDTGNNLYKFYYGIRIDYLYDCAYHYWHGDKTKNPRMEYVLKLPVKIGKKLS